MHGIRLSGYDQIGNPLESTHAPCWGIVGSSNVFKNITNGISAQNSSKFANIIGSHFCDVDSCIHSTLGTSSNNDPSLHRFDFTANKTKKIANLQYLNHSKLGFAVDGTDLTSIGIEELSGRVGTGFNHFEGIILNASNSALQNRYSHDLYNLQVDGSPATGAILSGQFGGGTIITNNCATGVSIFGNYNNLNIITTNSSTLGFACGGTGNVVQLQTDSNSSIAGSNNIITGRISGNLTVTGTGNKFIGEILGSINKGSNNDYSQVKGFSGLEVLSNQITDSEGKITITVPKHQSATIREILVTLPTNISGDRCEVVSISGSSVVLKFITSTNTPIATTSINFNYSYTCN